MRSVDSERHLDENDPRVERADEIRATLDRLIKKPGTTVELLQYNVDGTTGATVTEVITPSDLTTDFERYEALYRRMLQADDLIVHDDNRSLDLNPLARHEKEQTSPYGNRPIITEDQAHGLIQALRGSDTVIFAGNAYEKIYERVAPHDIAGNAGENKRAAAAIGRSTRIMIFSPDKK